MSEPLKPRPCGVAELAPQQALLLDRHMRDARRLIREAVESLGDVQAVVAAQATRLAEANRLLVQVQDAASAPPASHLQQILAELRAIRALLEIEALSRSCA